MLLYAVITINLAFVFYSLGVWSEKYQGVLKLWHLVIFWIGFVFDTTGTSLMGKLAEDGFKLNFHGITGLLAIILMLVHVIWATTVLVRKNKTHLANFHKFSIVVWLIWLIPFISGAFLGMTK